MIRHPKIKISFLSDAPLAPLLDLYEFSAASDGESMDIRPQQVLFDVETDEGTPATIEVFLGCRRTSGASKYMGIDLYGNDRLFVQNDQHIVERLLAKASGPRRDLVRGFINIKGGNAAIPWDTHKRHLNLDASMLGLLRQHA